MQHHKLFFGGLLPFAFQYWQPTGGMISAGEKQTITQFAQWLDGLTGNNDNGFADLAQDFLTRLSIKRAEKFGQPESNIEHFRKWLIVEAGYFEIIETPSGARKEAKSISFAKMSQEEFDSFYSACRSVVWNLICRACFDDETALQAAIDEYIGF